MDDALLKCMNINEIKSENYFKYFNSKNDIPVHKMKLELNNQ